MKNEQIFEILDIDYGYSMDHINVMYDLEGKKNIHIPIEDMLTYLNRNKDKTIFDYLDGIGVDMDENISEYDLCSLGHEALLKYVHEYLFKYFRVDLIIKNRKLEDKIKALEEENQNLKAAFKCHFNILNILIKSYSNFKNEAKDYLTNPMHLVKFTMCDSIIRDLQEETDFIQKHI